MTKSVTLSIADSEPHYLACVVSFDLLVTQNEYEFTIPINLTFSMHTLDNIHLNITNILHSFRALEQSRTPDVLVGRYGAAELRAVMPRVMSLSTRENIILRGIHDMVVRNDDILYKLDMWTCQNTSNDRTTYGSYEISLIFDKTENVYGAILETCDHLTEFTETFSDEDTIRLHYKSARVGDLELEIRDSYGSCSAAVLVRVSKELIHELPDRFKTVSSYEELVVKPR